MCFVWISEQAVTIFLYSINFVVCVTQMQCIYWAI